MGRTSKEVIIGKVFKSNTYGQFLVESLASIRPSGKSQYNCRFLKTGYLATATKDHIIRGEVMDRYLPTNCGVGYIGDGIGDAKIKGIWKKMLERCYTKSCLSYPIYGGSGVVVCEEWLNFSNFQRDYLSLPKFNNSSKLEIDKDIIGEGKIYSKETCCLVPRHVNSFIRNNTGVTCGSHYNEYYKKYDVRITINYKEVYLGYFDNPRDANLAYLRAKYARLLEIIEECDSEPISNGLLSQFKKLCTTYDTNFSEVV